MKKYYLSLIIIFIQERVLPRTRQRVCKRNRLQWDNEPLAGINLVIEGTSLGTSTNEQGRYIIWNITAGEHKLVISGVGFESKIRSVQISSRGICSGRLLTQ
jgi:iron complex outermembrane recepter protein